ncbi:MAG: DUF4345 family protein [Henriciella sp.]|nr:DUF4345 family protein [Henriciella sp.]
MTNRIFLTVLAIMFIAFGFWSITDPVGMTTQLGVEVGGDAGVFEMRGVFGGISLGGAILCLLGAFKDRFTFAALCFVTTYMGGYAIGRAASLIAGDSAPSSSWIFAGLEFVAFVFAAILTARKT